MFICEKHGNPPVPGTVNESLESYLVTRDIIDFVPNSLQKEQSLFVLSGVNTTEKSNRCETWPKQFTGNAIGKINFLLT